MTTAERHFKRAVVDVVLDGAYPSPKVIREKLGRPLRGPLAQGGDTLNGRETRWRREILSGLGWVEAPIQLGKPRPRHSWTPPESGHGTAGR